MEREGLKGKRRGDSENESVRKERRTWEMMRDSGVRYESTKVAIVGMRLEGEKTS